MVAVVCTEASMSDTFVLTSRPLPQHRMPHHCRNRTHLECHRTSSPPSTLTDLTSVSNICAMHLHL